ncbi:TetR/AcrR family transcriptional regulator [Gordonia terrae]|uniref:TetR/AcrR family transcriptional regulator n=2 Tax=Gordonia terrae TaxID=2055 RepID=A0AAD0K955_9ACTN|nr:TetR/AcrR family transcriptional regulator [Gordonia terrae]
MIDAALAIFSERPYEAVSTAELATAAGTTRTNLNYHFGSKKNLYIAALRRFTTYPLGLAHSASETSIANEAQIASTFDRWLSFIETHHEPFKVLTQASKSSFCDDEIAGLLDDALSTWEDRLLIMTGQSLTDRAARARVRAFQAMIGAATAQWLEEKVLSKDEVCGLLTRALPTLSSD